MVNGEDGAEAANRGVKAGAIGEKRFETKS
jgi:hypothetical protein